MKGELVIARAYGGEPLVRRVWSANDRLVYITNEEEFQKGDNSENQVNVIGFPREDIFTYNEVLAAAIGDFCRDGTWDWEKLSPWKEAAKIMTS